MPIKRMLNNYVLAKEVKQQETVTSSGIIIIGPAKTKSTREVEIVQVPDNVEGYKAGDIAHIGIYAGIECTVDGEEFIIITLQDIILIQ